MGRFEKLLEKLLAHTGDAHVDDAARELLRQDPKKYDQYLRALKAEYGSVAERQALTGHVVDGYHGTSGDIKQFDNDQLGSITGKGSTKSQHWVTDNPEVAEIFGSQAAAVKQGRKLEELAKPLNEEYNQLLKEIKESNGAPRPQGMFEIGNPGIDRMVKHGEISPELGERIKQYKIKQNDFKDLQYKDSYDTHRTQGTNIMPVSIRQENPKVIDAKGGYWQDLHNEIGNGEAQVNNLKEGGPSIFGDMPQGTSYGVIDPANIRSKFAAFDPRFKKSRDILAGTAGATALGATATMGDDSEASPLEAARKMAEEIAAAKGLPAITHEANAPVNVERAKRIAQAYEDMPHNPGDPAVQKSYDALINETTDQFKKMKENGLKVTKITPEMGNPYKNSADLIKDIHENNHMYYFPTEAGFGSDMNDIAKDHPMLKTVDVDGEQMPANDIFRIVHDYFGHGKEELKFGPKGEENAWQQHMQMYSPEAQKALTTETRGQNSWVNYGPHGEENRLNPANTKYAEQKANLMPEWAYDKSNFAPKQGFPLVKEIDAITPLVSKAYDVYRGGMEKVGNAAGAAIDKVGDLTRLPGTSDEMQEGITGPVKEAGKFAAEWELDPLNYISKIGKVGAAASSILSRQQAGKLLEKAIKLSTAEGKPLSEAVNTLIKADKIYSGSNADRKILSHQNSVRRDILGHGLMEKYGVNEGDNIGNAIHEATEKMAPGFDQRKMLVVQPNGIPTEPSVAADLPFLSPNHNTLGQVARGGETGQPIGMGIYANNFAPDNQSAHQIISTLGHELGHVDDSVKYGVAPNYLEKPYDFKGLGEYSNQIQAGTADKARTFDEIQKRLTQDHHLSSMNQPIEYKLMDNLQNSNKDFPNVQSTIKPFTGEEQAKKLMTLQSENPEQYNQVVNQITDESTQNPRFRRLIQLLDAKSPEVMTPFKPE